MVELGQGVGQGALRQLFDAHQQGAGVVLAAGQMGGTDQGLAGGGGFGFGLQDAANAVVAEHRPDAVADQQETLAFVQLAFQVIHHQMLIQAQGALEHMLHARLLPDMLLSDALQLAIEPAIHPAVADVGQGKALATKHHGAEGGQQRLAAAIGLQPAVLGQQQPVQGLGHAPGLRRGVVVQGQGLQGRARGQATVGTLADAVGDSTQVAFARGQLQGRGDQAQGVLVFFPWPDGAGLGKAQLQGHCRLTRAQQ